MDIARTKRGGPRRYVIVAAAVAGLAALSAAVNRLESRPPSVARSTLWIDTVRRGTMLRQVRAPGTLLPEYVRIISAVTAGRVETLPIKAGTGVTAETVLAQLSNPDVQLQALDAERQLSVAEGALVALTQSLASQRLTQTEAVAAAVADAKEAARNAAVFEGLDSIKKGLAGANELARSRDAASETQTKLQIERERLRVLTESIDQQIALQKGQVDHLKAIARFNQSRIESMRVTAGENGVLQELPLELGQWVTPGMLLARVSQPGKLKAVLRVPETQVTDVVPGQVVSVDTRNGVVPGRVDRVEPAVQNGTVGVDVILQGDLPPGARADLSVDGTIEIERLENVLYVGRPAFGLPNATVTLFKLAPDGGTAVRQTVKLGRSSVTTIEVLQGLAAGERVVISDMSASDNVNKVRIE